MHTMMTARFEKRDFKRIFLYIDILVIAIFSVALVMLVRNAYAAGFYEGRDVGLQGQNLWYMARDAVFVATSLAWIFFRYFRTQVQALTNPWA